MIIEEMLNGKRPYGLTRTDKGLYAVCPDCSAGVGTGKLPGHRRVEQCPKCGTLVDMPYMADESTHEIPDLEGYEFVGGFDTWEEALSGIKQLINGDPDDDSKGRVPSESADDMNWIDISTEAWREYTYPDGDVIHVPEPTAMVIKRHPEYDLPGSWDSHRIKTAHGISYYIPQGWICLRWAPKDGCPEYRF